MCGRFVQYSDPEIYASRFDLDNLCEARPRYNIAPTQSVLAIRPIHDRMPVILATEDFSAWLNPQY